MPLWNKRPPPGDYFWINATPPSLPHIPHHSISSVTNERGKNIFLLFVSAIQKGNCKGTSLDLFQKEAFQEKHAIKIYKKYDLRLRIHCLWKKMFLGFKKSSKHPSQLKTSVKQIPPHEKHIF